MKTVEGAELTYRNALACGRMILQRCRACATAQYYPRAVCTACGSTELDWETINGAGTVYSTSVVRRRPEHGGNTNIALIDLVEGARLLSTVVGVEPDKVRIGDRVSAHIDTDAASPRIVFQLESDT